jgi:aquaporin Z
MQAGAAQIAISTTRQWPMIRAFFNHWPEYLSEAAGLGSFMISACTFAVLLGHPSSPVHQAIDSAVLRSMLAGIAMGLTLLAIVFSPFGQRSGAHLNPAITLNYWLLGKIEGADAAWYAIAQFTGGMLGVFLADLLIGFPLRHSSVNYAVTVPGPAGSIIAFAAEFAIALILMLTILVTSNHRMLTRYTPFFAASLVALYITVESPLSGMSMNPARTFASAFVAMDWTALWVYFTAPPLAMVTAGWLYRTRHGAHSVLCAKLHHDNDKRCIFHCEYALMYDASSRTRVTSA